MFVLLVCVLLASFSLDGRLETTIHISGQVTVCIGLSQCLVVCTVFYLERTRPEK